MSVDYRLAPEHPWPAAPEDCETAALWLIEQAEARFGTTRLAIGGFSAGATLATTTLLRLRDRGVVGPFVGAALQPLSVSRGPIAALPLTRSSPATPSAGCPGPADDAADDRGTADTARGSRPRRRYYQFSSAGAEHARRAIAEASAPPVTGLGPQLRY